ncbi:MAG: hypothetical protein ABJL55_19860 [Roseibium sp.]
MTVNLGIRNPINPLQRNTQLPTAKLGPVGPQVESQLKKTVAINAALTQDNRTPTNSAPRLSTEAILAVQYVDGAKQAKEVQQKTNPFIEIEDDPLTPVDESEDKLVEPVGGVEEEDLLAIEEDDPFAAEEEDLNNPNPEVDYNDPTREQDDEVAATDEEPSPEETTRPPEDETLVALSAYKDSLERARQSDEDTDSNGSQDVQEVFA